MKKPRLHPAKTARQGDFRGSGRVEAQYFRRRIAKPVQMGNPPPHTDCLYMKKSTPERCFFYESHLSAFRIPCKKLLNPIQRTIFFVNSYAKFMTVLTQNSFSMHLGPHQRLYSRFWSVSAFNNVFSKSIMTISSCLISIRALMRELFRKFLSTNLCKFHRHIVNLKWLQSCFFSFLVSQANKLHPCILQDQSHWKSRLCCQSRSHSCRRPAPGRC